LPYTIGKKISDYPAQVLYSSGSQHPVINYSEGLLIDYRWFDAVSVHFDVSLGLYLTDMQKNIAPRYAFGFGLSYTTFDYSKASVSGSVGSYTPPSGPGSSVNSKFVSPYIHISHKS
jgi:beta-glucosidase